MRGGLGGGIVGGASGSRSVFAVDLCPLIFRWDNSFIVISCASWHVLEG